MKRLFLVAIFFHTFYLLSFSQANRRTIIENKIKAITQVEYKQSGDKRKETKTYYSAKGDDSLIIINGETAHSFTAVVQNGRTVGLERMSAGGLLDEIHTYKYNADSSYSIEILLYEEKALKYYEFNAKHDCLLAVFFNSDTMRFGYNSEGKLKGFTHIKNGEITTVEVTESDSAGNTTKFAYYNVEAVLWGFSVYKNNDKGLPEEIKQFAINGDKETYMSKTVLNYEFYYP